MQIEGGAHPADRIGLERGTPYPGLEGVPPPIETGWGTPGQDWMESSPCQETDQHSGYLLHGKRYTSCIYAGGLSCFPVTSACLTLSCIDSL